MAAITAAIPRPTSSATGIWSWLTTVDHKRIGVLYGVSAFILFLIGGIEAGVMRMQLMVPDSNLIAVSYTHLRANETLRYGGIGGIYV